VKLAFTPVNRLPTLVSLRRERMQWVEGESHPAGTSGKAIFKERLSDLGLRLIIAFGMALSLAWTCCLLWLLMKFFGLI
jgi:hypothetical protein